MWSWGLRKPDCGICWEKGGEGIKIHEEERGECQLTCASLLWFKVLSQVKREKGGKKGVLNTFSNVKEGGRGRPILRNEGASPRVFRAGREKRGGKGRKGVRALYSVPQSSGKEKRRAPKFRGGEKKREPFFPKLGFDIENVGCAEGGGGGGSATLCSLAFGKEGEKATMSLIRG